MKNSLNKLSRGFSLVELSVVIVIISILAGSIIISSSIIKDANLASAQQITANAPVAHIDGLEIWLETSLKDSLEYNESTNAITKWVDISGNGRDLTTVSSAQFLEEGGLLKGLPSVYLNGTASISRSAISIQEHTAFVVAKVKDGSKQYFFYNGSDTTNGFGMGRETTEKVSGFVDTNDIPIHSSTYAYDNIASVFVTKYDGTNFTGKVNNASSWASSESDTVGMPTGNFQVGGSNMVEMEIAEIIIYNRALFNSEVDDIVDYLMKKYDID